MLYHGPEARTMKKGYLVKEFAELTKVTVRTLRFYDRIGLLKPGFRKPNGYRVYADEDLLRLQQIVTLKFMGFSLSGIGELLNRKGFLVAKSLRVQAEAVRDEIARLQQASRALGLVLRELETKGRIDAKKLIKIVEVIQMGEDVKKAWHEKFFTKAELEEFAEIGTKYTPEAMADTQRRWAALIDEVKRNLGADPAGEVAQSLAERWAALLNEGYGNHPGLKARIGEAYTAGTMPAEHMPFGPEVWGFIKKAQAEAKKRP
jgi:DNA-binding transcriptional MerR regulator